MKVAAVVSDLMMFSRIDAAAEGHDLVRADRPADLPAGDYDLVLVDWTAREPDWTDALASVSATRILPFGRHTDLDAHAAARAAGLGPMWARSKLVAMLPSLLSQRP